MQDFYKIRLSNLLWVNISSIYELLWNAVKSYPHSENLNLRCASYWLLPCLHFLRLDDSVFYLY